MTRIAKITFAALASLAALAATSAGAVTISNPRNSYGYPYLSGALVGGQQTQYIGETFTAPISGNLTNFQFTLNTSNLTSVYGIVFGYDGTNPTTELWRSAAVAGTAGLVNFAPLGVSLTQGQTYVAFLSTYGLANNSGLATVGSCNNFTDTQCTANAVPNLGTLVYGNVYDSGVVFSKVLNNSQDATFSATIIAASAVPELATWTMMITGMGAVGVALRRRHKVSARVNCLV